MENIGKRGDTVMLLAEGHPDEYDNFLDFIFDMKNNQYNNK